MQTAKLVGVREWADAELAVGRQLRGVMVGWHCFDDLREPVLLWLLLDDQWVEVCTTGDGAVRFALADEPADFDMAEYGRFEMTPAGPSHPLQPLIGSVVRRTGRVTWRRTPIGVVLYTDAGTGLLVNEWDEIFVSGGELPAGYRDAVIGD